MKKQIFLLLSLSLLVLVGCSDKVGLKGKAMFSDDKSPIPTGSVCFETSSYFARAELNPDGTFTVGSLKANDGLPPGKYNVYIAGARKPVGTHASGETLYEPLIDPKFASGQTSEITIEVTASTKYFEVFADRYAPGNR